MASPKPRVNKPLKRVRAAMAEDSDPPSRWPGTSPERKQSDARHVAPLSVAPPGGPPLMEVRRGIKYPHYWFQTFEACFVHFATKILIFPQKDKDGNELRPPERRTLQSNWLYQLNLARARGEIDAEKHAEFKAQRYGELVNASFREWRQNGGRPQKADVLKTEKPFTPKNEAKLAKHITKQQAEQKAKEDGEPVPKPEHPLQDVTTLTPPIIVKLIINIKGKKVAATNQPRSVLGIKIPWDAMNKPTTTIPSKRTRDEKDPKTGRDQGEGEGEGSKPPAKRRRK